MYIYIYILYVHDYACISCIYIYRQYHIDFTILCCMTIGFSVFFPPQLALLCIS